MAAPCAGRPPPPQKPAEDELLVSYLLNDPASFADEMIDGFVAANGGLVRRAAGGVVRRSETPAGQVAVVIGGGSGHYPAFAGLVGPGLAHGAAMGNVFASPSAQQICSVAKAVASDAGVLFSYGNYAGDVLNFDQAQDQLVAEGIPCRTVAVSDDVSSAGEEERHRRRGIAGDLVVFKAAAWAAEQGRSLDDVWALASTANERTRTLGVAFSGCTLPGADQPLFEVPSGRMAVGMGIHGEPGIEETAMPTAKELAHLLVSRVLESTPKDCCQDNVRSRAAVILNGLGSVKCEELFVTYRTVSRLLDEAGITPVQPEVGEMVTSFEMAGVSLTLCWLDDELESAWTAPAASPAYRRGAVDGVAVENHRTAYTVADRRSYESTPESRKVAVQVLTALSAVKRAVDGRVEELGRLDAVAGDGDHGIGMQRGADAAVRGAGQALEEGAGAGSTLAAAADAWADRAGGTSGALWGVALRAVAAELGDESVPEVRSVAAGVRGAAAAIARFGKASVGDKTMLDAVVPFSDELASRVEGGASLAEAWRSAAAVASAAAQASADLLPRMGRARPHADKSLGTPDPGAVSFALAMTAVAATLTPGSE